MLSRQILVSSREGAWAQSGLLWWILLPHLDVWDTGSPSSIPLQPYSWSLDWGSWQFSGVIEVLSSPNLAMVSTILSLQHPLGIMGMVRIPLLGVNVWPFGYAPDSSLCAQQKMNRAYSPVTEASISCLDTVMWQSKCSTTSGWGSNLGCVDVLCVVLLDTVDI